jgi:hypothetical protein
MKTSAAAKRYRVLGVKGMFGGGGRFDAALGTELRLLAHKGKNDQINSLPNYA